MKRLGIAALTALLVLTGCSAPAPTPDRTEATEAFLEASYFTENGETVGNAMKENGVFKDVAGDLVKFCDDDAAGMPYTYASQVPDMEDMIISAWDIACPDDD